MKLGLNPARGALVAALVFGATALPAQAQLRSALDTGEQATRQAERTQTRINQLDDERSEMVREYRTILQKTDAAKLYAAQQEKVVESQRRELESLNEQLGRVDEITAQMIPMMVTMIEDLKTFVAVDLPFKSAERQEALNGLDAIMERADIPPAEKYRLIIEAYQNEMQYGSTVDTWQQESTLDPNDPGSETTTVTMFQYGRVALLMMSADERTAYRFNRDTRQWDKVGGQYISDIKQAVKVVNKLTGEEVLYAPVSLFDWQAAAQ